MGIPFRETSEPQVQHAAMSVQRSGETQPSAIPRIRKLCARIQDSRPGYGALQIVTHFGSIEDSRFTGFHRTLVQYARSNSISAHHGLQSDSSTARFEHLEASAIPSIEAKARTAHQQQQQHQLTGERPSLRHAKAVLLKHNLCGSLSTVDGGGFQQNNLAFVCGVS